MHRYLNFLRQGIGLLISISFLAALPQAFAKSLPSQLHADFNPETANRQLDKLTIGLSVQDVRSINLEQAVAELSNDQNQAKKCVLDKNGELSDINKQLQAIGIGENDSKALTADQKYLLAKRAQLTQQLAQCRLYIIRAQEAISVFSTKVEMLNTHELLSTHPTLWENFKASSKLMLNPPTLHLDDTDTGFQYFNRYSITLLGLWLLLALSLGLWLRRYIKRFCISLVDKPAGQSASRLKLTFLVIMQHYIAAFTVAITLALFATFIALLSRDITDFTRISYILLLWLLFQALASFCLHPDSGFNHLSARVRRKLNFRVKSLAYWSLLGFILYILLRHQSIPLEIANFSRSIFVIISAINLISIIWLTTQGVRWFSSKPLARILFNLVLSISLSVTLLAEIFGYYNLSDYILAGTAETLGYGFLTWVLYKSINTTLQGFSKQEYRWQRVLYSHLGLAEKESVPEFICLKVAVNLLLALSLLFLVTKVWGLSANSSQEAANAIVQGFTVANLHITPLRIVFGLLAFALLSLSVRWLRQRLLSQALAQHEQGSREALAIIIGYLGFGLAVLFAALLAGINFTGFAVIAGALSVGIGFGLQNIVNNFVSGIILLIERPIKPGDRIMVGQAEGYVKEISVRSTRITTGDKSDIIVPNSELISAQVTNFMFQDREFRIKIPVGVAYGSDVQGVSDLLLAIGGNHPKVIKEPDASPLVFFRQFADSCLQFELSCIIDDINQRSKVISELNFIIDREFRKAGIDMPFPQRDIHIKSWPLEKPTSMTEEHTS
jgi:potassium efflux system protein